MSKKYLNTTDNTIWTEEDLREWRRVAVEVNGAYDDCESFEEWVSRYAEDFEEITEEPRRTCVDCCYLGRNGNENRWYCNCGSSVHYEKEVTDADFLDCEDFEG